MREFEIGKLGLAVAFSLTLAMAGCGGGGDGVAVNPDTDGDGIPDTVDAAPNNAARFVDNVTVLLAGLSTGNAGFTTATAINTAGAVAGFSEVTAAPAGVKAVRWQVTAATGAASAPVTLNPPTGGTYSAAYGVSAAGLTVGEAENGAAGSIVAATWPANAVTGTAATILPASATFPATGRSAAYGVNTASQIVGEATTTAGALRAVVWNGATGAPVDLGILTGGTFSTAHAINDGGVVVGEADTATGATHAVAWRVNADGTKAAGPVDLGVITVADVRSSAYGIDSAGRVVGESENAAGVVHAGMWTLDAALAPTTKKDLGANGSAYAINESGRIAGHLGTTDLATVWDVLNTALPNSAVPETTLSQAFGMNNGNLVVGLSGAATGARAFVAVPK